MTAGIAAICDGRDIYRRNLQSCGLVGYRCSCPWHLKPPKARISTTWRIWHADCFPGIESRDRSYREERI